jgi:hypothetical protein
LVLLEVVKILDALLPDELLLLIFLLTVFGAIRSHGGLKHPFDGLSLLRARFGKLDGHADLLVEPIVSNLPG